MQPTDPEAQQDHRGPYGPDTGAVNPFGVRMNGRDVIRRLHLRLFKVSPYRGHIRKRVAWFEKTRTLRYPLRSFSLSVLQSGLASAHRAERLKH